MDKPYEILVPKMGIIVLKTLYFFDKGLKYILSIPIHPSNLNYI